MKQLLSCALLLFSLAACKTDYANLPAYSGAQQVQAVIEIPAGSAYQLEYDAENRVFPKAEEAVYEKVIDFMPYPVNYGFIPSTIAEQNQENPDKPLAIGVIGESQTPGTVQEVNPVGVIVLERESELFYQIIAVPAKPSEQSVRTTDFNELQRKYPAVKRIVELWFQHVKPGTKLVGWKNEKFAEELIRKKLK